MEKETDHGGLTAEMLRHLDALYKLARWLARDPEEAEDLVQETYLRAIRAAHQFRPGINLRAWLFRILRNTFFTQYKRKGRELKAADPEVLDQLFYSGGAMGAGDRSAGSADGAAGLDLTAALNRLAEAYRSVVLLVDLENLGMKEVPHVEAGGSCVSPGVGPESGRVGGNVSQDP